MPKQATLPSVETLSRVKQVLTCDLEATVNSFLATGDWILMHVYHTRRGTAMYVIGRIA